MDKIKMDFLKKMRFFTNELYEISSLRARQQFEKQLTEIVDSLQLVMYPLLEKYENLEKQGVVGNLVWIYISYLRSGIISNHEYFRIDCYNLKNRSSSIECAENWKFSFLWSLYEEDCEKVKEEFEKQTRAKMYEFDFIKMEFAENYYKLSMEIFPFVIKCWLEKYGNSVLNGKSVAFMAGEFLDKSEFVLSWEKECIVWDQTDFTDEQQEENAE